MSFGIDPSELPRIVDFDRRDEPALLRDLTDRGGAKGLARLLATDVKTGVSTSGAGPSLQVRKDTFGANYIPPPPIKSLFKLVVEQFEDRTLQILLVGGTVSLILGAVFDREENGWIEGLAIYLAIIIVVSVTAINDYIKEKKFRKAQDQQKDREVKVMRDGKLLSVSTYECVVGDLVDLTVGDEVPADGVYVRGLRLQVDEAALTGESKVVKKSEERPFMFAGAVVAEGDGTMLVTTVGAQSAGGRIQELLNQAEVKPTPLQEQLDDLAVKIGWFGMAMGLLTFLALTIRWAVDVSNEAWDNERLIDLVHYFVIGVTIVVVAVPEGLPLAVTIALAFSMLKMIRDRNFVRHLDASETMGEATCICSDKTGTLTQNRMTVTRSFVLRRDLLAGSSNTDTTGRLDTKGFSAEIIHHLAVGMSANSKAYLTPATEPGGLDVVIGNKTEGALINLAKRLGTDYTKVRESMKLVEQFPFTSDRKRMSTIIEPLPVGGGKGGGGGKAGGKYIQYVKGASEIVLELCRFEANPDGGKPAPLSRNKVREYEAAIDEFARQGLRTLTVAFRWLDRVPKPDASDAESDLVLLGVLGIKDPVREQVPGAVKQCQSAGITVRMVTGDNILTANHIAAECGILTESSVSIEGPQFRAMTDEQRLKVIPRLRVLARSSPEDKQVLVKALMSMGEVVAVTGDGTNDAPALKEADVGFAMGIAGTDIAKNASDIILLDDNFASIANAIKWGRNVFDAIRKFLQFQLAVNVVALVVVFVGSVAEGESPMSTVQLLWVNLIMDTLGALALATGDPEPGILDRMPHRKDEGLMTRSMIGYISVQFVTQTTILLVLLFHGYKAVDVDSGNYIEIHTLVFCTFVLMQCVNMVTTRQLHNEINIFGRILENWLFLVLLITILAIQVIVVQFGKDFTETVGLSAKQWGFCVGLSVIPAVVTVIYRIVINAAFKEQMADSSDREPHHAPDVSDRELNAALSSIHGTVSRPRIDSTIKGHASDDALGGSMVQSPSFISIGRSASLYEMYENTPEKGGGGSNYSRYSVKNSRNTKNARNARNARKPGLRRGSRSESSSSRGRAGDSYYYDPSSSASSPSDGRRW